MRDSVAGGRKTRRDSGRPGHLEQPGEDFRRRAAVSQVHAANPPDTPENQGIKYRPASSERLRTHPRRPFSRSRPRLWGKPPVWTWSGAGAGEPARRAPGCARNEKTPAPAPERRCEGLHVDTWRCIAAAYQFTDGFNSQCPVSQIPARSSMIPPIRGLPNAGSTANTASA